MAVEDMEIDQMKKDLPIWMLCDGTLGCGCPKLRKASGRRWRGGPLQHGERRMYQAGCRCEPCNQANRTYIAKYRANKKEKTDGSLDNSRVDSRRAA